MNARYSPLGDNSKEDFSGFLKKSFIGMSGAGSSFLLQFIIIADINAENRRMPESLFMVIPSTQSYCF